MIFYFLCVLDIVFTGNLRFRDNRPPLDGLDILYVRGILPIEPYLICRFNSDVLRSNLNADDVFKLLSHGLDSYYDEKLNVVRAILKYFLEREDAVKMLFLKYFDVFVSEFLTEENGNVEVKTEEKFDGKEVVNCQGKVKTEEKFDGKEVVNCQGKVKTEQMFDGRGHEKSRKDCQEDVTTGRNYDDCERISEKSCEKFDQNIKICDKNLETPLQTTKTTKQLIKQPSRIAANLKYLIAKATKRPTYEYINEIRDLIKDFFAVTPTNQRHDAKHSRQFEFFFSEFMLYMEKHFSIILYIDRTGIIQSLKLDQIQSELFDENLEYYTLFTDSLKSVRIKTSIPILTRTVVEYLQLILSQHEHKYLIVEIFHDFFVDFNPFSTANIDYILNMSSILNASKSEIVEFHYFNFLFRFENGKIIKTNIAEKFYQCLPISVLATFSFDEMVEDVKKYFKENPQRRFEDDKDISFLFYFGKIFDYLRDLIVYRRELQVGYDDFRILSPINYPSRGYSVY